MSDTSSIQVANIRPIQILSPQLANQIAAGEVVERPASVVKELVENSIDANATQIHIEIEQGGQKRILIRDNGDGISKAQLALALSRHATSKIANIDDLEHITSMGFRGEALASISSVSRLTLTSKPKQQTEAWQAVAEGHQMDVQITPAAHPDGTSIEVVDLFFNTPARRKFLRTGKTEFQHIENIVKRIALTQPHVQFVLIHNQKVCSRYGAVANLPKRIEQVCGKKMLEQCVQVEYHFEGVRLQGWCSKLGFGLATRDFQYTFVNDRMMRDKLLSHALRQVYEDTLPPQTFAAYVLYLHVPPEQLDVNVHPAKHEVRFHQARQIHDLVFKAVNDGISQETGIDNVSAVTHDYILPLVKTSPTDQADISREHNAGAQSIRKVHAYQSNTPSRGQIRANQEFYQRLPNTSRSQTGHMASAVEAELESDMDTQVHSSALVLSSDCLYSAPYLVFSSPDKLSVLHLQYLLQSLITQRVNQSTLAQPLLMPVSVSKADAFDDDLHGNTDAHQKIDFTTLCNQINQSHFLLSHSHQKVLLKKVPSELRQLPWASMFPQIDFSTIAHLVPEQMCACLWQQLGLAWFNALAHQQEGISSTMINAWLKEVDTGVFQREQFKHAKSLQLPAWMQHE